MNILLAIGLAIIVLFVLAFALFGVAGHADKRIRQTEQKKKARGA